MFFYNQVLNIANNTIAWSAFGAMVNGLICSWACYRVCLSKGYSEDESCMETGFGYLFSWIWLIVCAVKPTAENGTASRTQKSGGLLLFIIGVFISILGILFSILLKESWSYGLLIVNIGVIFLMFAHSKV